MIFLNEQIIHGGKSLHAAILLLFNKIIKYENIPPNWKTSLLIPIYKGNSKPKCDPSSYRPISLLPCLDNFFEKLLLDRFNIYLQSKCQIFPCLQQQGFQKGVSCITAAFNVQETVYHQIEQISKVFMAFLDIKGAYDSVWHKGLLCKVGQLGITGKILRLLVNSYYDLKCAIRGQGMTSLHVTFLQREINLSRNKYSISFLG